MVRATWVCLVVAVVKLAWWWHRQVPPSVRRELASDTRLSTEHLQACSRLPGENAPATSLLRRQQACCAGNKLVTQAASLLRRQQATLDQTFAGSFTPRSHENAGAALRRNSTRGAAPGPALAFRRRARRRGGGLQGVQAGLSALRRRRSSASRQPRSPAGAGDSDSVGKAVR